MLKIVAAAIKYGLQSMSEHIELEIRKSSVEKIPKFLIEKSRLSLWSSNIFLLWYNHQDQTITKRKWRARESSWFGYFSLQPGFLDLTVSEILSILAVRSRYKFLFVPTITSDSSGQGKRSWGSPQPACFHFLIKKELERNLAKSHIVNLEYELKWMISYIKSMSHLNAIKP